MIETRCISKTFGTTIANDCLSITIRSGEILGVLGENGAGKSTILSILAGRVQPDSGDVFVDGSPVVFGSPRDALRAGVSVAYQHFSLVPTLSVLEQLRLAGWASAFLPDLLRSRFDGSEHISRLSLGERQVVEIAKALVPSPRVLLLDEPTSILTAGEARQLFDLLEGLRREGTSVVLVTHKLGEAMEVCDRIVVLRRGRAVDSVERAVGGWEAGTKARLLGWMFDREAVTSPSVVPEGPVGTEDPRPEKRVGDGRRPLFGLGSVSTMSRPGRHALHEVSFKVGEGEICAIVGVDGQGQRELADVCAGYTVADGTVTLRDRPLPAGNQREFSHAGIAYLTDDRMDVGTIAGSSIEDNLVLKRQREWPFSRHGLLRRHAIRAYARQQIALWQIEPPDPAARVETLSGGNIQKVLLARELAMASSLLVAHNPSRGLDPWTSDLVWQAVGRFAGAGGAVLVLTADVDEALRHAHRVGVMYDGRVSSFLPVGGDVRVAVERMMVSGW